MTARQCARSPLPSLRAPDEVPGQVEISVLGPIEVLGAARPFTRAWALDLVVYLAVHPRGSTVEAWSTALWPDRVMAPPTLHSTASAARRCLGRDAEGLDHLPHGRGRLRLRSSVGTDWRRFSALAARDHPAGWEGALSLVRGRPFDGLRNPDWVVLEGLAAEVEDDVARVALALAEWRLARGDGPGAAWAARRGLLACPYDERLYRQLMRAADCEGNPAGVRAALAELLASAGDGSGWLAGTPAMSLVHPETAALYQALSRGAGAARGVAVTL